MERLHISNEIILRNLNILENRNNVSEIDTQIFLVEPILLLSNFDIYNPNIAKRANRGKDIQGDIEIYNNSELIFFIEVKSIKSSEFRNINNQAGILSKDNQGRVENKSGDGLGQLRKYIYLLCKDVSEQAQKNYKFYPILTNGKEWIIFNNINCLISNIDKPLSEVCIEGDYYHFNISTQLEKLLETLRELRR